MNVLLAIVASIVVVSGLFAALFVWFEVLNHRFHGTAEDFPIQSNSLPDDSTPGLLGDQLRTMMAERR